MATLTSRLIVALTDRASGPARGIGAALDSLHRRASRTSGVLLGAGGMFSGGAALRNLVAMGAGYVGVTRGIGGTVGAAIKFEEAFADVRKVVDGTPAQLSEIRAEILAMSKTMPTSAEGIAAIYAAAGQSNIPIRELGKFGEMVAKVAVAWETTEGETSEALAKIKTQLNMNVDQIGLYADAINHLGNNTAATAPDLVDFSRRVAANGEMFGFSATQTLAFGGAMVAMGAQTEVAATSFRNMGRALTIGERATKSHRVAFSKLGLDAVKTAKNMQKDALGTTLSVIDKIAGLPEWQRISIASALFGDEARALMPVISNSKELRRQIGLVAREADYAGSAFEEYMVRAETSGNALAILGNKIRGVGIGIGDSWLPSIKQAALGIGDVLDTLNKRVGVLDQIKASFDGFMAGIGYGGTTGLRELMNDLGDVLFGEAFKGGFGAVDERVNQLAGLSNRFRGIGRDLAAFSADISAGNIGEALGHVGDALSKMSGSVTMMGAVTLGLTGRALLGIGAGVASLALSKTGRLIMAAYAIATIIDAAKDSNSLGEFADNLGKLSAFDWLVVAGGLGLIGARVWQIARGLRAIKGAGGVAAAAGGAGSAAAGAALGATGRAIIRSVPPVAIGAGVAIATGHVLSELSADNAAEARRMASPRDAERASMDALRRYRDSGEFADDMDARRSPAAGASGGILDWFRSLDAKLVDKFGMGATTGKPADVSVTGPVETRPTGTQNVRVTNPMPAPVINVTVNATTNASPGEIGSAAASAISRELNALSNGAYSDGAN